MCVVLPPLHLSHTINLLGKQQRSLCYAIGFAETNAEQVYIRTWRHYGRI